MKKILITAIVLMTTVMANATLVTYDGTTVDIEDQVGTGNYEAMIVIDWVSGITRSHAWLYKYDGYKTVGDAFDALQLQVPSFAWSQASFVTQMDYNDGVDDHHDDLGGWNSFWNKDTGMWTTNWVGVYEQSLFDGGWAGAVINDNPWGDIAPVVPVPEPATMALVGIGAFLAVRRKKA